MRRQGRRHARGGGSGGLGQLTAAVRALAFSMFEADSYNIDGGTSKIGSWIEKSTHASSVGAGHLMSQATSAQQCAVPTVNSLFLGRVSATFVDQRYVSSAAASAWKFLHDGTGCTVYEVFSLDSVTGAKYRLSTSYGSVLNGWNTSCSGTTLATFIANGTSTIATPSGGTVAVSTAYYTRMRYAEGASPEVDAHIKTTLAASTASTSAAPSSADPTATLMLGNRVVVTDSPFVGKWLSTIILKGAYSATADTTIKAYFTTKYGVT